MQLQAQIMPPTEPICNEKDQKKPEVQTKKEAADAMKYDENLKWSLDTTALDNLSRYLTIPARSQINPWTPLREIDYFFELFGDMIGISVHETNIQPKI
ncbi:hypothetical protein JTB14_033705 [Gonioctena quinquepunctata]|nr:hypothetical protein JTB14_033705 [Gonioctena quinquepunctata]